MESNLFEIPADLKAKSEVISTIINSKNVRIEKIVSRASSSPKDFWYDQSESEWVCVLQGNATLKFFDKKTPLELNQGDFVLIEPHQKHRVERTSENCVWLAIFF